PLLAARLELMYDWHMALAMLGVLGFLMIFIFAYFIKDKRETPEPVVEQKVAGSSMRHILKTRNFYLLAIGSMCSIGVVGGIGQHIKLYVSDLSYSQQEAANVMSFVLLSSLIGRVVMGWLADIVNRKYVMLLIYLIVMWSIPLLLVPEFPGRIYLCA